MNKFKKKEERTVALLPHKVITVCLVSGLLWFGVPATIVTLKVYSEWTWVSDTSSDSAPSGLSTF